MDLSAFQFDLPEDRIALRPAEPQDAARLLVVRTGGRLEDRAVHDLPALLSPTDILIFNTTRVLAAALKAIRPPRNAQGQSVACDVNLIEQCGPSQWRALARPGRRLRIGDRLEFAEGLIARIAAKHEDGEIDLEFSERNAALLAAIDRIGAMPLPPYIASRRPADASDRVTYQPSLASGEARSVAAPTAALHFTPQFLANLAAAGITHETVRLDVGLGTFKTLTETQLAENRLHPEHRTLSRETADRLNAAFSEGRRLIPVGTTALRTLESAADLHGHVHAVSGPTQIFLKPGDTFRVTGGLITNFHLPGSSLFMLVCALMGTEVMQAAYAHAIKEHYRFYSYGDACLLLP